MPFAAKTKLSEEERAIVVRLAAQASQDPFPLLEWLDDLVARKRQNEIARRWKADAYKKGRCWCGRAGCKKCAKRKAKRERAR